MAVENSLVLIKPDAVQRRLSGEMISRFERKGLQIKAMRMLQASQTHAEAHYAVHRDKPFFGALVTFITSSPLIALIVSGDEAVAVIRNMIGPTDGRKAPPGTIRGDFGCSLGANLVHASDSVENAEVEAAIWFPGGEGLVDWQHCDKVWLDAD